jgi:hypothetical protein
VNAAQHLVMTVLDRDGYRCVCCGTPIDGERGRDWSLHHRRPRGMGGTHRITTAANLIAVCGSGTTGCHHRIEAHRAEARANGWLLWQNVDPESVAVLVDSGSRWVYLTSSGGYGDAPRAEEDQPETAKPADAS